MGEVSRLGTPSNGPIEFIIPILGTQPLPTLNPRIPLIDRDLLGLVAPRALFNKSPVQRPPDTGDTRALAIECYRTSTSLCQRFPAHSGVTGSQIGATSPVTRVWKLVALA